MNIKMRVAFWLVNVGIKLLPAEYRHKDFVDNCMLTKKIKVGLKCNCEGCERERNGKGGYQPCVKSSDLKAPGDE